MTFSLIMTLYLLLLFYAYFICFFCYGLVFSVCTPMWIVIFPCLSTCFVFSFFLSYIFLVCHYYLLLSYVGAPYVFASRLCDSFIHACGYAHIYILYDFMIYIPICSMQLTFCAYRHFMIYAYEPFMPTIQPHNNVVIPETCYYITHSSSQIQVHGGPSSTYKLQSMQPMMHPVLKIYKPVARKVKPVPGVFPEDATVHRQMPEDPLLTLSKLPIHPPDFVPTAKITHERLLSLNINSHGFLWPEEEKLFSHIMVLNEKALAFEDLERGTIREDYFSPYIIPTVPHIPWEFKNIPIPPGIRNDLIELLKDKIAAGVYEPSQSSYRSPWFCVPKKNGKLRIVHDLQPLNAVTIRDAEVPPILDEFVEQFAKRQCYTVFDLYWGYDARKIHIKSRDLTSFLSPLGLLRLTSLPMGFTNSPAEFQRCMTFILKEEIPQVANVFIDDVPIKGPESQYLDKEGNPETVRGNPGIRRFIWEHANDVHRVLHRVACAGATFTGKKVQICLPEVVILGQKCNSQGRLPEDGKVSKILNWPRPRTVKEVRGFVGLCGVVRIWIQDYSMIVRPLTEIWRKGEEFIWDERREEAFQALRSLVSQAPALRPIDYTSPHPLILAVDSSYMGVGIVLSQIDEQGRKHPARYGSIPFNDREASYSQPKLELYGLFRALRAFRQYLYGAKKLQVEMDAKYIKGMLKRPDLQPNATMNRWIQGILLFDFELVHIPAAQFKGPDALSRREATQEEKEEMQEDDEWLEDIALYITNPTLSLISPTSVVQTRFHSLVTTDSKQDQTLKNIEGYLRHGIVSSFPNDQIKKRFIQKTTQFFLQDGNMYKKRSTKVPLRVVLTAAERLNILTQAHEDLSHRGIYGVFQTIKERFYWPRMFQDVEQHVKSCHECQIRSVKKVEIPITISAPATLFSKIYVDVMLMPRAHGFRYIVAARDDLSLAAEGRALRRSTAVNLAKFFWEEIICRYGTIGEVVTDNGPEIRGAFEELMRRYEIPQIKISPYNSKANGVVERGHFIIREGIVKSCQGNINQWPSKVHHAFFADKCITRKSTGFSPYYLLYGVDPVLPFDLTEATFLVHGFHSGMKTEELLALRIRQLEKRPEDIAQAAAAIVQSRLRSKEQFEKVFRRRLTSHVFEEGDLVLVRNSQVEKELDKKHKPRYLGPFQIVRRTKGGSYVLKELDGTVSRRGVARFRLLPYVPRAGVHLPQVEFEERSDDDKESDNDSDEDASSSNEE